MGNDYDKIITYVMRQEQKRILSQTQDNEQTAIGHLVVPPIRRIRYLKKFFESYKKVNAPNISGYSHEYTPLLCKHITGSWWS